MGKRQRHTDFVALTDEEILAIARDSKLPKALRLKAVRECKFRGIRDRRKRSK